MSMDDKTTFDRATLLATDFSQPYFAAPSMVAAVGQARQKAANERWTSALSSASWQGALRLLDEVASRLSSRRRSRRQDLGFVSPAYFEWDGPQQGAALIERL